MAEFIFVYHGGGTPSDPAEVEQVMSAWNTWYQNIGAALVNGGGPLGAPTTVTDGGVTDGGGANPASGFTIVRAESHDAANKMAAGCPILQAGGTVEVAEVIEI